MTLDETIGLIEELNETIDGLDPEIYDAGEDFFESVREKANAIQETIDRRGKVSEAQSAAIVNMLEGVRKWDR